ncbi:MAG: hypothetical protein IPH07_32555 [Deltaproteobacteria bacterium]|nr:hypothetical protein [Deltaproteobacteria bacterium]MBK8234915.1 hypothetical protein [Deltaproteobacteria bacterium]MBK8719764.1 hypothetical protein [Deltaproteobacteria bacterium]MBP7285259.1 hypothetical protein [Nannocystaceae bacterium]
MKSLASSIVAAMLVASPPARPATTATDDSFYTVVDRAEAAAAAGALADAAVLYEQAYDRLAPSDRAAESGTDVVSASIRVRKKLFVQAPADPAPIEAAIALLERHLSDIAQGDAMRPTAVLRDELEGLRKLAPAPARASTPSPSHPPGPTSRPSRIDAIDLPTYEGDDDDEHTASLVHRRGRVGAALLGVGAAVLTGGVTLLAVGAANRRQNDRDLARATALPAWQQTCASDPECGLLQWRDSERSRNRTLFASGAVLTGVAVGLLTAGIVALARARHPGRRRQALRAAR